MPNLIYWMCGVRSARRPTCQALTSLAREFRAGCRACRAGRAGTVDLRHVRLDVLGADAVRRREIVASRRRDPIGFAKNHRAFSTFLKFYEAAKDLCDALAEFPDNPDFDRLFRNLDIIAEARANTPDGGKSFFGKFFTATEEEKAVGELGVMLKNIGEGLAHAARTIRPLDKVARYLGASGPGLAKLQAARGAFIEFERAYRAALKAQAMEPAEPGDLIPDHSRQLGRDLLFRDWSGNQDRLVDQDEGAGDSGRSDDPENSKGKGPDGSDAPAESRSAVQPAQALRELLMSVQHRDVETCVASLRLLSDWEPRELRDAVDRLLPRALSRKQREDFAHMDHLVMAARRRLVMAGNLKGNMQSAFHAWDAVYHHLGIARLAYDEIRRIPSGRVAMMHEAIEAAYPSPS